MRMRVSGERSSCETLASSSFWPRTSRSTRSAISLKARVSWTISSAGVERRNHQRRRRRRRGAHGRQGRRRPAGARRSVRRSSGRDSRRASGRVATPTTRRTTATISSGRIRCRCPSRCGRGHLRRRHDRAGLRVAHGRHSIRNGSSARHRLRRRARPPGRRAAAALGAGRLRPPRVPSRSRITTSRSRVRCSPSQPTGQRRLVAQALGRQRGRVAGHALAHLTERSAAVDDREDHGGGHAHDDQDGERVQVDARGAASSRGARAHERVAHAAQGLDVAGRAGGPPRAWRGLRETWTSMERSNASRPSPPRAR